MATRDLTRRFKEIRKARPRLSKPRGDSCETSSTGNLIPQNGVDIEMTSNWEDMKLALPPKWVDKVDEVNHEIADIRIKMDELKESHTKRLMISFDSNYEGKHDQEIEAITSEITSKFRSAEKSLQGVAASDDGLSASDKKLRTNIQRKVATELQELSKTFRKSQKHYLARVLDQKQSIPGFDFDLDLEEDTGFTDAQMQQIDGSLEDIESRDAEITNIARSIEELAVIFKELAVLVIDQGTILDRIDYNMEQVDDRVNKGLKELVKAEEHQKSSRPLKCMLFLLVMIGILLFLVIQKYQKKGKDDSD